MSGLRQAQTEMSQGLTNRAGDSYSRVALWIGWKLHGFARVMDGSIRRPDHRKPRLLMLPNVRGWAFDDLTQQRARHIASTWDVDIQYVLEGPEIDPTRYDHMFNPNWGFSSYDALFMGRYVRGINSHKWERGPRPYHVLRRSLQGAVACLVPNQAQVRQIRPAFPPTFLVKEGIEPSVFYWIRDRASPDLVVGWTGNQSNLMKRLETVVKPACARAGVDLRIAEVPTRDELNLFYNDVDVVLIGSEPLYEGNPLSLFEAGACGRTVIATSVGAVPEVVQDGVTGFVVEATSDVPRTVQEFVNRLNWCKAHMEQVRQMGKLHREQVLQDRPPERTCEQFWQAIEWAYGQVVMTRGAW